MERETTSEEATRFGSSQPNVAKSVGTGEEKSGTQTSLATIEINKARKVQGAEISVEQDERVADAGDAG